MDAFEAGLGPKQWARIGQWVVGIPLVWSFVNGLMQTGLPDPLLSMTMSLLGTTNEWWARLVLAILAFGVELSDKAIMAGEKDYEGKVHEIVKGIGDRLRSGSAIETAVAEAIRTTDGPSEVFERAIELSDAMPFDAALREAADACGSEYLKEVCYLVAEAVSSEGDTGGAIRRLGMELERNQLYISSITSKIANPVMVMRGVGLFFVPPLYALLRASVNNFAKVGHTNSLEPGATLFFMYGAVGITVYDGLIFGQWDRLFARMPFAFAAVYIGLTWIS